MTIDLDKIDELALRATPGPWRYNIWKMRGGLYRHGLGNDHGSGQVLIKKSDYSNPDKDLSYFAAVSPDIWLAVSKELRELRAYKHSMEYGPEVNRD